jgi:hypothetical protein
MAMMSSKTTIPNNKMSPSFLCIILFHLSIVSSFSSISTCIRQNVFVGLNLPKRNSAAAPLWAKKPTASKKNTKEAAKSGGGFGDNNAMKRDSLQGKLRSVSGHQGSGTKPLRVSALTFDALRKEYGPECCNDVYCKSTLDDPQLYWFVGKVAIKPNTVATPAQAVIAHKKLIFEYAKKELRPQNFGGKYSSSLELYLAPGDSEMDAARNLISLEKVVGSASDLHADFTVKDVGFNPEIYVGDEIHDGGLRVRRDDRGNRM